MAHCGSVTVGRGARSSGSRRISEPGVSGSQGLGRLDVSSRGQTYNEQLLSGGGGGSGTKRLARHSQGALESDDLTKLGGGGYGLDAASFQRARAEAMGLLRGPSSAASPSQLPGASGRSSDGAVGGGRAARLSVSQQQTLPLLRISPQQAGESPKVAARISTSSVQMAGSGFSCPRLSSTKSGERPRYPWEGDPVRKG